MKQVPCVKYKEYNAEFSVSDVDETSQALQETDNKIIAVPSDK